METTLQSTNSVDLTLLLYLQNFYSGQFKHYNVNRYDCSYTLDTHIEKKNKDTFTYD